MAIDPNAAYLRAERAYEFARARRAAAFSIPLFGFALLTLMFGARPLTATCVGLFLSLASGLFLWRGQALGRSVGPGVLAGVVPLGLALAARSYGHLCTESGCVSLCIPACTLGGLVAGLFIAQRSRHAPSRGRFVVGASLLALLVGTLGCSCVGYGGVVGLGGGLLATLLPSSLFPLRSAGGP